MKSKAASERRDTLLMKRLNIAVALRWHEARRVELELRSNLIQARKMQEDHHHSRHLIISFPFLVHGFSVHSRLCTIQTRHGSTLNPSFDSQMRPHRLIVKHANVPSELHPSELVWKPPREHMRCLSYRDRAGNHSFPRSINCRPGP